MTTQSDTDLDELLAENRRLTAGTRDRLEQLTRLLEMARAVGLPAEVTRDIERLRNEGLMLLSHEGTA